MVVSVLAAGPPPRGAELEEASRVVRISRAGSRDPLFLAGYPPGTHFDAGGVRLEAGASNHFRTVPRFARLHDPRRDPARGIGYPETEVLKSWELPIAEIYPVQLRDLHSPSISGFTVIGMQSRDLPWRVMKAMWDGDALHVKGCSGRVLVSDVHWENVEDGFGPSSGGLESWRLENAYMKFIRDDAVENDDLIPGEIVNCLIDGCFVFLSQRPDEPKKSRGKTVIRDCVIHVQAQPHDGTPGGAWRDPNIRLGPDGMGRAPGMIFKWAEDAGNVHVKNCVFRMDAMSFNGPDEMSFPPGDYENVTLIWLGEGAYPKATPPGVAITNDLRVWEQARSDWIDRLSPKHPAAAALKKQATLPSGSGS